MMLIEQLHALTNPNEKYPSSNSYQSNNIPAQAMPDYSPVPMNPTKKLSNVYKMPISKIITTKNLNLPKKSASVIYAKKYTNNKNLTEVRFIPNSYKMNNETGEHTLDSKSRPLSPPLYNFLRGNFDLSDDKHSMLRGLPKGLFSGPPYSKAAKLYRYKLYQSYKKRRMNSTLVQQSFKIFPLGVGIKRYNPPLLNKYPISKYDKDKDDLLNKDVTINDQAAENKTDLTDHSNENSRDVLNENLVNMTKADNTTSVIEQSSEDQKVDENDDFDDESSSIIPDATNETISVDLSAKIVENIIPPENVSINNDNFSTDENTNKVPITPSKQHDIPSTVNDLNSTNTFLNNFKDVKDGFVTPMYNTTQVSNTNLDVNGVAEYKTNIKIGNSDPTCFRSKVFYNVTLRGGYDSGKFKDRGKMKDVIECATLCCHLSKCDLVMMLLNRCFSVDCKSSKLCEAVPAKSPVFSPTICYVSHL